MPPKGFKVITIPEEIYQVLQTLSKQTGHSMSQLVSEAINQRIGANPN